VSGTAFKLIAGHVALDLLNTVEWRLDQSRAVEDLTGYGDVLRWGAQTELLDADTAARLEDIAAAHPRQAAGEHGRVIELREIAYAAIVDQSHHAVTQMAAHHREALAHAVLVPSRVGWAWTERPLGLRTPRDRLARSIVELLTTPDLKDLRQCQDEACGWVFLDTSPRHNRRWCSAADCGSRNRARRYYAHHKNDSARTRERPTGNNLGDQR
jgi:predicted RNA-binding Zn ribbon-like protein